MSKDNMGQVPQREDSEEVRVILPCRGHTGNPCSMGQSQMDEHTGET